MWSPAASCIAMKGLHVSPEWALLRLVLLTCMPWAWHDPAMFVENQRFQPEYSGTLQLGSSDRPDSGNTPNAHLDRKLIPYEQMQLRPSAVADCRAKPNIGSTSSQAIEAESSSSTETGRLLVGQRYEHHLVFSRLLEIILHRLHICLKCLYT